MTASSPGDVAPTRRGAPRDNREAYALLPYEGSAHRDTHPASIAVLARLHGLEPADPTRCRVLEIGCAAGRNLLPMAASLPGAELVGVDLAERHIAEASRTAREIGADNVRFLVRDIAEGVGDLGTFDYVIAHGVYSWLPPELKPKLLGLCREALAPNGIAYVSHNVFPGWHRRGALREMMLRHTRGLVDPAERIAQARSLLEFLSAASSPHDPAWKLWLHDEVRALSDASDSYIFHEFLAVHNEPGYFLDFAVAADACDLQYVADAQLPSNGGHLLPDRLAGDLVDLVGGERVSFEQYQDYVLGRTFRKSLLTARQHAVLADPAAARLAGAHVLSAFEPIDEAGTRRWGRGDRRLGPLHAAADALLDTLAKRWPASVPVEELFAAHRAAGLDPGPAGSDLEAFCEDVLGLAMNDVVMLNATPITAGTRAERPVAWPWVRAELAAGHAGLTSIHHTVVSVSPTLAELCRLADGTRDRAGLLEGLIQAWDRGVFRAPVQPSPEQLRAGLEGGLDLGLAQLHHLGLLQ